ncbi:MAG: magnesium protoporphyrin IX methyltransferase [Cyanobacteria bacterium J06554_3]
MTNSTLDDKAVVREYFNATGFDRWQRIYGDGDVNKVQANIRTGHQKTIDNVLEWFAEDEDLASITVCDAGCGVGSLSIPLAKMGAKVYASDISEKMAEEAAVRAKAALSDELTADKMPEFEAKDLEAIDNVLEWFAEDEDLASITVCDAGCGVGSLSIPLAKMGAKVYASDISEKMAEEAAVRAKAALSDELTADKMPEFEAKDLEAIDGKYHTVVCLDVLIHYPQEKADDMIKHLSSLASDRVIMSFAPKTCFYATLKKVGDFFPGPSKATRAYLHRESDVVKALEDNGWTIGRRSLNKAPFYFSRLIEATRDAS